MQMALRCIGLVQVSSIRGILYPASKRLTGVGDLAVSPEPILVSYLHVRILHQWIYYQHRKFLKLPLGWSPEGFEHHGKFKLTSYFFHILILSIVFEAFSVVVITYFMDTDVDVSWPADEVWNKPSALRNRYLVRTVIEIRNIRA